MKNDRIYYVWKFGAHYHQDKSCIMLAEFDHFGYIPMSEKEIIKRQLQPCNCVTNLIIDHQSRI
jgi:hypothetical protein